MKKQPNKSTIAVTDYRIEKYTDAMTSPESLVLQEVVKSSIKELDFIDMLSGNGVGQLLKILIKTSGARRILEIGTFTGYSALAMAEALPKNGKVITLEMNVRYQEIASYHFDKFDDHHKITMLKGDARELLGTVKEDFDLVFLDADKVSYPMYFEQVLPLLKSGGLLVADNTLWSGTVLEPEAPKAKAIDEFNKLVAADNRVEQILLPVRDGITLIRKKEKIKNK
ncbi:MAG: class I SAM-dependent methyltransferase [Balneolaceae bacterium]